MRSRCVLTGARGWGLVLALTAALAGTVAVQLPASAGQGVPAPVAAGALGPVAPTEAGRPALSQGRGVRAAAPGTLGSTAVSSAARRPGPVGAATSSSAPSGAAPSRATPSGSAPSGSAPSGSAPSGSAPSRPTASRPAGTSRPPAATSVGSAVPAPALPCSGTGWQQRRGAAALASLRRAPSPARTLVFRPARSGFLGLTRMGSGRVEVYVRSCSRQSDALLRHVVAHELGHAYDAAHLTPASRTAWLRARGIPVGTPWQGCDRCTDFATPAGDFAETYAQWRRGASDSRTRMAHVPGRAELDRLATRFFGA